MPITPSIQNGIGADINANVENDRIALAAYLDSIENDDELFLRCLKKAVRCLHRFNDKDRVWINTWLPIIFRDLNK